METDSMDLNAYAPLGPISERREPDLFRRFFLPAEEQAGKIGFYPVSPKDWHALPLPLRFCTISNEVAAIKASRIFDDTCGMSYGVELRPEQAIRMLFTLGAPPLDHWRVIWRNGSSSFAKWWRDQRTGCFQIAAGTGGSFPIVTQGGYQGHLPRGLYIAADGRWQMASHLLSADAEKLGTHVRYEL